MVVELVMWKSPARSAFWFGSGSMLFFSSFSRDINFRHVQLVLYFTMMFSMLHINNLAFEHCLVIYSPISVLCHFGVLTLVLAFFKDSIPQRYNSICLISLPFLSNHVMMILTVTGSTWNRPEVSS